jgi:glycogen synthase
MTHYVTLSSKASLNDTTINFSFGSDFGVWTVKPTEKANMIAHMIVHEVQEYTRHSRQRMAKHFNWEKIIKKYANMYSLNISEAFT